MNNLMDLIQEGNIGLMHALRKFDPDKGVKLSYYASFWIKAYILKFIMENWKLVKVGTTQVQRKLFYNLKREKDKLKALGFEPSYELLAEAIGVSPEEVEEMDQRLGSWDLSLDAPLREDSDEKHVNFLPSFDPYLLDALADAEEGKMFRRHLDEFRWELNRKEVSILDFRLLADDPKTLDEIGKMHEISKERIRQIEERLIEKFRIFLKAKSAEERKKIKQAAKKSESDHQKISRQIKTTDNAEDAVENFSIKWVDPASVGNDICRGGEVMRPKYEKKKREISPDQILFFEAVRDANLADEETVRSLLGRISLEALGKELDFEVSIDQLVPFFQVLKFKHAFTQQQARCFLIFFGRGGISAEKISPYVNISPANIYTTKQGAIKKLKEFANKIPADAGKPEAFSPTPKDAVGDPVEQSAVMRLPAPKIDYPDPEKATPPENISEATCRENCPFAKLLPFIDLITNMSLALKSFLDKIDQGEK